MILSLNTSAQVGQSRNGIVDRALGASPLILRLNCVTLSQEYSKQPPLSYCRCAFFIFVDENEGKLHL